MKNWIFILFIPITTLCQAQSKIELVIGRYVPIETSSFITIEEIGSRPPDRVDAGSFIVKSDGSLFGVYNHFRTGEGGDEGESYVRKVIGVTPFESTDYTLSAYDAVSKDDLGDLNGSLYRQDDNNIIMLFLSQSDFDDQVWGLKMRKSTDAGATWGAVTTLSAGTEERWITAADRIYRLSDGVLLFPASVRPTIADPTERIGRLWKSLDNGDTWSVVEVTPGNTLEITNVGGVSGPTEPGLYEDANDDLWYYFRCNDGAVRGCKLIRSGNNFDKGAVVDILDAPASTTTIKYIPAINKWLAIHNDIADGISGFDARKRLVYSLSDTGLNGSFTQQTNPIGTFTTDWGWFEPSITIIPGGIIVCVTNYRATPIYFKYGVRVISNEDLISNDL